MQYRVQGGGDVAESLRGGVRPSSLDSCRLFVPLAGLPKIGSPGVFLSELARMVLDEALTFPGEVLRQPRDLSFVGENDGRVGGDDVRNSAQMLRLGHESISEDGDHEHTDADTRNKGAGGHCGGEPLPRIHDRQSR